MAHKESLPAIRHKGLNANELLFVEAFVELPNASRAGRAVGIAPSTARAWLNRPKIAAAILMETRRRLARVGAMGLRVVCDMLASPETDERVRASLARWSVEQALGKAPEAASAPADDADMIVSRIKDLSEELGDILGPEIIDITPDAVERFSDDVEPEEVDPRHRPKGDPLPLTEREVAGGYDDGMSNRKGPGRPSGGRPRVEPKEVEVIEHGERGESE